MQGELNVIFYVQKFFITDYVFMYQLEIVHCITHSQIGWH